MKNDSHRETLGSHEAERATLVTCPEREERCVWKENMERSILWGEACGVRERKSMCGKGRSVGRESGEGTVSHLVE